MHIPKVAGINQSQLKKKSVKQKQRRDECKESDISSDDSCLAAMRKLRKFNIGFVPKKGETLYSKLCKLKHRNDPETRKNVVYAIECETCGVHYVGETGQHFCERRKQYERDVRNKKSTSGIYDHLRNNEGHSVNWAKLKYVEKKTTGKAGRSRRQST